MYRLFPILNFIWTPFRLLLERVLPKDHPWMYKRDEREQIDPNRNRREYEAKMKRLDRL